MDFFNCVMDAYCWTSGLLFYQDIFQAEKGWYLSFMKLKLEAKNLKELENMVGEKNVLVRRDQLIDYSHDEFPSPAIHQIPLAVVKPQDARQVKEIVKWANREKVPITARGGGTGLCGGCIAEAHGIVVSFEKLNRIVEIDVDNQMAVVESGVRLMDFYEAVEKKNLFFPPHPGDESATIGGVIATNAGGARAVKYGVIRNFIKGLEVVLPEGDIVQLGGKVLKNSTGYNLINLLIGSEGTLGIITQAIIHLIPPPKAQMTLIAPFDDLKSAIHLVPALSKAGIIPMAVEFIEVEAIHAAEDFMNKSWPCKGGKAHLMIIVDGFSEEEVLRCAEVIGEMCTRYGAQDVFVADEKGKQKEILEIRSRMYETIKAHVIEVLDIIVPPSQVPGHVEVVHELSKKYNMWLPTFGHAADGNVHTHLMKAWYKQGSWFPMPEPEWKEKYLVIRKALHDDARKRGGLVSAEHGIGLLKKEYLEDTIGSTSIEYMRRIKKVFDPNNILNPNKIF